MKNVLIIFSLLVLAGCSTYSASGTKQISDHVRISVGFQSGYYYPDYYRYRPYNWTYYQQPVVFHHHHYVAPQVTSPQVTPGHNRNRQNDHKRNRRD